ncbi:MAG: hypothetical protein ALAOOOJD_04190 [bacterium]|nr:hypothetical protein [bacterium]
MHAAFLPAQGVDFVDDDIFDGAIHFSRTLGGEHDEQRLRRSDEDMWRAFEHFGANFARRVTGAHEHANLRHFELHLFCGLTNAG